MHIQVRIFGGMRPSRGPDVLEPGEAQLARDVRLTAGELRPLRGLLPVTTLFGAAPAPTLTLSAAGPATVGAPFSVTLAAANLTGLLPAVPESVSGPALTFTPATVNPAPGELVKLFSVVAATAGTARLRAVAAGVVSNELEVQVNAAEGQTLTVNQQVASLAITNETAAAGARPYVAAVMPPRGAVPAGSTLTSSDGAARAAILSTWDDGSAAVAVVSGAVTLAANGTAALAVHAATGPTGAPATAAMIAALIPGGVSIDFGGVYGVASLPSLAAPERVWWAMPGHICARYRVAAPTPGGTSLEAVIDVHAWADRAFVEVAAENGRVNPATPVKPAAASYTGAVVTINGAALTPINGNGAPEGNHAAFRGWYASGWVGTPAGVRANQLHTELQNHPLFWLMATAGTANMATYAADTYTPWSTGRQRAAAMGGPGDHESIGPLPLWEAQWLQTGDYRAARAVEANALAVLGYNIGFRSASTGLVPTPAEVVGKDISPLNNWPTQTISGDLMTWDFSHQPAVGLAAFLCRPSPVYIELAQRAALWTGLFSNGQLGTGTWHYAQVRGRAWGYRGLTHAIWLTPDSHAWKASGKAWLAANAAKVKEFKDHPRATLGYMWAAEVDAPIDFDLDVAGYQASLWEHHFMACEFHKASGTRLLSGSQQAVLNEVADWLCTQPVRWVTEQANGGWRYVPYKTTLAASIATMGTPTTYGAQMATAYPDAPSGVSGSWMTQGGVTPTAYSQFSPNLSAASGLNYPRILWSALATAVQRGVAGAAAAMQTVQANITSLSTWLDGFGVDPRHGVYTPPSSAALAMPTWAPAASSTPGTAAVSILTVANGGLANNLVDVHAPTNARYRYTNVISVYAGAAYSPNYGTYGAVVMAGAGHASSNYNGVHAMVLGQTQLSFKRFNNPTPVATESYAAVSGTDQNLNDTDPAKDLPKLNPATCAWTFDGQAAVGHTWGYLAVRENGDIVLPWMLSAAINQPGDTHAFACHVLTPPAPTAAIGPTNKWALEHVSPTLPYGNDMLLGHVSLPGFQAYDAASKRRYLFSRRNNAQVLWYDETAGFVGDRYVFGNGTRIDTSDSQGDSTGPYAGLGAPPVTIIEIPERRLAVMVFNVTNSSPRRLAARVFDMAAGSWNPTRFEFSLQIAVDVDWSCAGWCSKLQRIFVGDIQGSNKALGYLVEVPTNLTGPWPATAVPLSQTVPGWRTTRSINNASDYGRLVEVKGLGLFVYLQQYKLPDAQVVDEQTSKVAVIRLPGV